MSSDSGLPVLPVLPVGLQDFVQLRDMGAVYVDKTQQLCHMISHAPVFSFVGRPRRFGKSLMLSSLRELFLGHRELFAGTWAYDHYDFSPFPVLYLDFTRVVSKSHQASQDFSRQFANYMHQQAVLHGVDTSHATDSAEILDLILQQYSSDNPVVVLIDEYDRPLVDRISEPVEFERIADVLKDFYVKLKANSRLIRRCVMTGITEFGKLSIFSGANQFSNLSLRAEYATLFGYTKAELETYFSAHVAYSQQVTGLDADAWWGKLKYQYNGYSWAKRQVADENRVYCPFTVLRYFEDPSEFANYWAQSGTSSLLMHILKADKLDTIDIERTYGEIDQLMSLDPHNIDAVGLLFQSGYLTFTDEHLDDPLLLPLGFPNQEIKTTLNKLLLSYEAGNKNVTKASLLRDMLKRENWNDFFDTINTIMAGVSYEIFHRHEHYAHAIIHTILSAATINIASQVQTNTGRIDSVITYTNAAGVTKHAIIELKTSAIDTTTDPDHTQDRHLAQTALDQIHTNNYTTPYNNPIPIGIVINTTTKQITAWTTDTSKQ